MIHTQKSRPRLLDLFCGAGGCARGYMDAGFVVVGVDINPQPNYCGHMFVQADALEFVSQYGHMFDVHSGSPPCQRYSITKSINKHREGRREHPDLVDATRDAFVSGGKPYVIENVPGAPLRNPIRLCGTMFGLRVFRHRLFESNVFLIEPEHLKHTGTTAAHRGYSTAAKGADMICVAGNNFVRTEGAAAMGIAWPATRKEIAQAIPPAYTRYIGAQLMAHLRGDSTQ